MVVGFPDLHNIASAITGQPPSVEMDVSVLTAYKSELRKAGVPQGVYLFLGRTRAGDRGALIDVAVDTDEDEEPQQVEPAAPPAPPAPTPPATCAHLCSGCLHEWKVANPTAGTKRRGRPLSRGANLDPRPQAQAASDPVRPPRPVLFHAFGLAPWCCVQR
eukprot:g74149.t1